MHILLQLQQIILDKLFGWQSHKQSTLLWRTFLKKCMVWDVYLVLMNLGIGNYTSQMQ